MTEAAVPPRSSRTRRIRRALLGGALVVGAAAAAPAAAQADPITWSELKSQALPQPVEVHPAVGEQKMIVAAIPGGGWSAGTNTLLDLYKYLNWWTTLLVNKGISVHVITHREGGYPGAVQGELADLGLQLQTIREKNPGVPICIYGLSSGGHLAAMLQIIRPDITKCVVSDGGPLDMEAFFQDSGELRGITLGDFFQGQVAQTKVREWFNTPEHPDNVSRMDPSTQTNRIGDLFAIEAGPNPDGSASDRSVGSRQGQLIADKIPDRTTVRYVHASETKPTVATAHNIYSSFLDSTPGGAEEVEARFVYGQAADWMLKEADKWRAANTPTAPVVVGPNPPVTPVKRKLVLTVRGSSVRPDTRNRVPVRIRCTGATTVCSGRVKTTFSGVSSTSVLYRVTAAKSTYATVLVPLSARQVKALTPKASVVAKVAITGNSPEAPAATTSANVRVFRTATMARKDAAAKKAEKAKKQAAAAKRAAR
jgi:hypothetical protein